VAPAGAVVGALVVFLAANGLLFNARQLPASAQFFAQAAGELRAFVSVADQYGVTLPYDPPPVTRIYIPAPAILRELIVKYGSPTRDALVPSVVRPSTPVERDRALWDLTGGVIAPQPVASPAPSTGPPPTIEALRDARLSVEAGCLVVRSRAGSAGTATFGVPDGSFILVSVAEGGDGAVRLGRDAPPDPIDQRVVSFPAGSWLRFDVPRLGDGSAFRVQLVLPIGSTARICGPPG